MDRSTLLRGASSSHPWESLARPLLHPEACAWDLAPALHHPPSGDPERLGPTCPGVLTGPLGDTGSSGGASNRRAALDAPGSATATDLRHHPRLPAGGGAQEHVPAS